MLRNMWSRHSVVFQPAPYLWIIKTRWWQLNYFLFSPWKLGKIPSLTKIFQMGWFNHQLEEWFIVPWNIECIWNCFFSATQKWPSWTPWMPPFQPFSVRVTENPIPKKTHQSFPSLGAHMFLGLKRQELLSCICFLIVYNFVRFF